MGLAGGAARRKLAVADHILSQTYTLVKDPKLLLVVLAHIADALDAGVAEALEEAVRDRRLIVMPADLRARLAALRTAGRIDDAAVRFVQELHETLQERKKAPVEFVRKERLVICDETYALRTLSEEQLKDQLQRARDILDALEKVNRT